MRNILVVDEHEIIRDALRLYFSREKEFSLAAEAENGEQALRLLENNSYDMVITDISMPVMNGIELMKVIREKYPDQKVLIFSALHEVTLIHKLISLGINGYLLKKAGKNELFVALRKILEGRDYFTEEVYKAIIDRIAGRKNKKYLGKEVALSAREEEILHLIADEYTNQEIADKLFLSVRTIETHKRNLLEKTGCKNTAGLVKYALEENLV